MLKIFQLAAQTYFQTLPQNLDPIGHGIYKFCLYRIIHLSSPILEKSCIALLASILVEFLLDNLPLTCTLTTNYIQIDLHLKLQIDYISKYKVTEIFSITLKTSIRECLAKLNVIMPCCLLFVILYFVPAT